MIKVRYKEGESKHYDRNIEMGPPSYWDRTLYNVDRVSENVLVRTGQASSTVLGCLGGKETVVHGSRAFIVQTPLNISTRIPRKDWDLIVTRNAKLEADMIEDKLDKAFGSNMFFVKPLRSKYGGIMTFRVMSRADGRPIVDVKESVTLPPYVVINDVRYKALQALLKRAIEILNDPKLEFRHWKARRDIAIINHTFEQMKWEKMIKNTIWDVM